MLSNKYEVEILGQHFFVFDKDGSYTPLYVAKEFLEHPPKIDFLENPKRIMDVGANVGVFAFLCAKRWPDCEIHCYEPMPENVHHLRMGIEANAFKNIVVHEEALSFDTMPITLYSDPTNSGSASAFNGNNAAFKGGFTKETVRARMLNAAVRELESVDLLKLDVEGWEFVIFNGFQEWARLESILVEVHPFSLFEDVEQQHKMVDWLKDSLLSQMKNRRLIIESSNVEFNREVAF